MSEPDNDSGTTKTKAKTGSAELCIIIGMAGFVLGLYMMLNPSDSSLEVLGRNVVNQQKLILGQTLTIVGAIFLAVGIRPR